MNGEQLVTLLVENEIGVRHTPLQLIGLGVKLNTGKEIIEADSLARRGCARMMQEVNHDENRPKCPVSLRQRQEIQEVLPGERLG